MASIKDNPGITTMPTSRRDWTKYINELAQFFDGEPVGGFVTLDTNQTITGLKTFTQTPLFQTDPFWHNSNVGVQINALTAELSPDGTMDYIVIYNAASGEGRKVLLDDIADTPQQAINDDNELLHHWFD